MSEHEDLMKRCQRGATNLNDANNLLAECYGMLGMLARYQVAYMEFSEKCDWARTWESPSELGKHIADVIHSRYDQIKTENEALRRGIDLAPDLYPNVLRIKRGSPEYGQAWMKWADDAISARKDAERYRWLRGNLDEVTGCTALVSNSDNALDELIDTAMRNDDDILCDGNCIGEGMCDGYCQQKNGI